MLNLSVFFASDIIQKKRRGVSMLEYGLLGGLIAVACVLFLNNLGNSVVGNYCVIRRAVAGQGNINYIANCTVAETFGSGELLGWRSDSSSHDGGRLGYCSYYNSCLSPSATSVSSNLLLKINEISPIVGFYGLVNADGTQVTTMEQAINVLNMPNSTTGAGMGTSAIRAPDGNLYYYEVKAQDGNTYATFYNNATNSLGYRNMSTGATYTIDTATNNISYHGITSGNLAGNGDI